MAFEYSSRFVTTTLLPVVKLSVCLAQMDNGDDTWQQYCVLEQAHNSDVNCVRWNPAEPDILASCSDDNEVVIWKLTE